MRLPMFEEALGLTPLGAQAGRLGLRRGADAPTGRERLEELYRAMVLGLRDYVDKSGFPGVMLGLSGGVDSRPHRGDRGRRPRAPTGCAA